MEIGIVGDVANLNPVVCNSKYGADTGIKITVEAVPQDKIEKSYED